jgi:hypothetical protein
LGFKIPGVSDRLNAWHQDLMTRANSKLNPNVNDQRGKMSSDAFEAEQVRLLNDQGVEAQVGKVKDAVAARRKYLSDIETRIRDTQTGLTEAQNKLTGMQSEADLMTAKTDADAALAGLPSRRAASEAGDAITHNQKVLQRSREQLKHMSDARKRNLEGMERSIDSRISKKQKEVQGLRRRLKEFDAMIASGKTLTDVQKRVYAGLGNKIHQARTEITALRQQKIDRAAAINGRYLRDKARLQGDIQTAKGSITTAQPVAAQKKAIDEAIVRRNAAESGLSERSAATTKVSDLQKRLNTLQGRKASHDPATAHTHAYKELETMLNNLRTSNPTIGGKAVTWAMDDILQRYGVTPADAFKQGGSISRNKINKFLNYAKG